MASLRTFVLVHGAWHGGWCWRQVADILAVRGHRVFTPTLTGLGERSHLLTGDINLDTHIADIVNVFRWERIENTVLCAHSYAGWPVSGALEHIHQQVAAIVFLDAHLPQDGERGIDKSNHREAIEEARRTGQPGTKPPAASEFVSPQNSGWVRDLLTQQPVGVALQPIRLRGARETITNKVYVRTTGYKSRTFDECRDAASAAGWDVIETSSTHDMMIDDPEQLAQILIRSAAT